MMNVEFFDRYDGMPRVSWFRACLACEAMGVIPMLDPEAEWPICPTCQGSRRCGWLTTIARIPRWVAKGARFIATVGPAVEMHPPHWDWKDRWSMTILCAYAADLGLWTPERGITRFGRRVVGYLRGAVIGAVVGLIGVWRAWSFRRVAGLTAGLTVIVGLLGERRS